MAHFPKNLTFSSLSAKGDIRLVTAFEHLRKLIVHGLRARFKHLKSSDKEFGKIVEGKNVMGVVQNVKKGVADVGMVLANPLRITDVDLSEPYTDTSFTFATDLPQNLPKAYAFIYPFDAPSWLCILISVLLMAVLFYITSKKSTSFIRVLLETLDDVFKQGSELTCEKTFLLWIWHFFCFVITASYAAVLLSFLTIPSLEKPVATFRELATAIEKGEYCAHPRPGTFVDHLFKTSGKEYLMYIEKMMQKQDWCFRKQEKPLVRPGVKRAEITVRPVLNCQYGKPPLSTKYISDDNEFTVPASLPINKKFCCKKDLDLVIRRINYSGLYHKHLSDVQFRRWLQIAYNNVSVSDEILTLNDLSGAFYILVFGHIISTLVFILEIISGKYRKPMKTNNLIG